MLNAALAKTNRFKVVRKLGEGGMGAVYECDDTETASRVALKTLLITDPTTLLAFKEEFRQFQDIHHPNLVSLGELFEEEGLWYFTMELVEGEDLIAYARGITIPVSARFSGSLATLDAGAIAASPRSVRGAHDGIVNYDRLRGALVQLGLGLRALHAHGKVHCDVKPSNVLVTRDGRVVVLDFGIATDVTRAEHVSEDRCGTPEYMAPEQASIAPLTPSADWYAVGTILFEALTGRLPFEGHPVYLLHEKRTRAASDPRQFAPDIPEDLAKLTNGLLATRPADRPSGDETLRRLGYRSLPPSSHDAGEIDLVTLAPAARRNLFVGRKSQLATLQACFATTQRERKAVAAYVQGESGVGKTALVTRFIEIAAVVDPRVVVLSGACYEHEAVPYKAVDGVVDALSRHLSRLPHTIAISLLPTHAATLAQAFPVLLRVPAFFEYPRPRIETDPIERRSRVFAALRELFVRMAGQAPLIISVDDLQWADTDSLALLGDILRHPDSPALMFVTTVRADEGRRDLPLPTGPAALPGGGELIQVPRLSHAEARDLVDSLAHHSGIASPLDADGVAREGQGYPLFLHELVRYHSAFSEQGVRPVALEDALWSRMQNLDKPARRLLEIVALASGAITQATATLAAGIDGQDAIKQIKQLRAAHFVRTTGGTRGSDLIEPYHNRTREAVRAKIPSDVQRQHHHRIAVVLESSGQFDPADLAIHWREAGDRERAVEYGHKAAARAEEALAFDRAVAHYRMISELAVLEPKERRALLVRLGGALANAGRSLEAAEVFREAAQGATPEDARGLATRAAEHLLRSGHIDEGLAELRRVLALVGLRYPATPHEAFGSLLWSRAHLALRGFGFRAVDEHAVPVDVLARIDACWAATTGLFITDQLRGGDFESRHLVLALSAGEPTRVQRGLLLHAVSMVGTGGEKSLPEARRLLDLGRSVATTRDNDYARASVAMAEETVAYLVGDFAAAIEHGKVAIHLLRSACHGVAWELASARLNLYSSLALTGALRELSEMVGSNLREVLEARDHYAAMGIQSGLANAMWLAENDPVRARREADQAIAVWSRNDAFLQHLMDVIAQVGIDLYEDKPDQACARVSWVRKGIEKAGLARVEFNRILILDVAARAMLAKARSVGPAQRRPFLDAAKRDVASLERERPLWGRALAAPKRACILRLEDHPGAHAAAVRAVELLSSARLDLYAAACAHLAGVTAPAFASYYEREQVVEPSRFARVFFPGW